MLILKQFCLDKEEVQFVEAGSAGRSSGLMGPGHDPCTAVHGPQAGAIAALAL